MPKKRHICCWMIWTSLWSKKSLHSLPVLVSFLIVSVTRGSKVVCPPEHRSYREKWTSCHMLHIQSWSYLLELWQHISNWHNLNDCLKTENQKDMLILCTKLQALESPVINLRWFIIIVIVVIIIILHLDGSLIVDADPAYYWMF